MPMNENDDDQHHSPSAPKACRYDASLSYRHAYYSLINVEEFPEYLAVARQLAAQQAPSNEVPSVLGDVGFSYSEDSLDSLVAEIFRIRDRLTTPETTIASEREDRYARARQFLPLAVVDGCWLQNVYRVGLADTDIGAKFGELYCDYMDLDTDSAMNGVAELARHVATGLNISSDSFSSLRFAQHQDFDDASFDLPAYLLAIGQFPDAMLAEIIGVHLAWIGFGGREFSKSLLRTSLAISADDSTDKADLEKTENQLRLCRLLVRSAVDAHGAAAWDGILNGARTLCMKWQEWLKTVDEIAARPAPDSATRMIQLLRDKAPYARGYHGSKKLDGELIDTLFDAENFDPVDFLDRLAKSRFVSPGHPDKSTLVNSLVGFGGAMMSVFSEHELGIIRAWIAELPADTGAPIRESPDSEPHCEIGGVLPARHAFIQRSIESYGACSVRDLYYYLVNLERYPEILPVAERFARRRLERAMAGIFDGPRPIPQMHYSPEAIQDWVDAKHREQIDSYRPPDQRPSVSERSFVEANLQLAPLILIDGGWLQHIPSPTLIHTPVGRKLFRILYEEIGEGDATAHHANIYRELLSAMDEIAPAVSSREFADWQRLEDSSFDVPVLWLSISCFPRHFLPEILGLNLAVEIAGIGGPYMEARDVLRQFKLPTLFVDIHNAADNAANGHAAQSADVIKLYLDSVVAREGPHSANREWQRVWSGLCATLPQPNPLVHLLRSMRHRLRGESITSSVPVIFSA